MRRLPAGTCLATTWGLHCMCDVEKDLAAEVWFEMVLQGVLVFGPTGWHVAPDAPWELVESFLEKRRLERAERLLLVV